MAPRGFFFLAIYFWAKALVESTKLNKKERDAAQKSHLLGQST